MFQRLFTPFVFAFLASTLASANAQNLSTDDFTPAVNCWSVLIYASTDSNNSPSFRRFQELATTLRNQSAAQSRVVVFSPFETLETRKPSPNVLRATLAWLRDADSPNAVLGLPAMRADQTQPVELRFILCGQTRGAALQLPNSQTDKVEDVIKVDDFIAAVRDVDSPCERALFFFNLSAETTTRGSGGVRLAPISEENDSEETVFLNDDVKNNNLERLNLPQSYYRTVFFGQSDEVFFESLTSAFQGQADLSNDDGVVTALETLEYLRDVAPRTPGFQRLGQDFPLTRSRAAKPARPTRLFAKLGNASPLKGQKELTTEALRRAFQEFRPDDYARLSFSSGNRPSSAELSALGEGRFTATPYNDDYILLTLGNSQYYLHAETFQAVAASVEQRKAQ